MSKKHRLNKNSISIQNIGKQRFWFGIIAGLISAISIALIFNNTRELIRSLISITQDLVILENTELVFFNYFFCSFATVLGLSITIWIWTENRTHQRKKHRLHKQQITTSNLFFFWLLLFLAGELALIFIYFIIGEVQTSQYPVNLYHNYWLLFALLPIVIFMQSWFLVRRIYKTRKWIFISFFSTIFMTLFLYKTTTINHSKFNEAYYKRHEAKYKYIEKETLKSEKDYGIQYKTETLETLKKRNSDSSIEQVKKIKKAFSAQTKVPLDTIIIQKIIIHNFKRGDNSWHWSFYNPDPLENWHYALPKDILKQIDYYKSNSNETKELFEILKEAIFLVNKSKIDWSIKYEEYKSSQWITYNYLDNNYNINTMLVKQLKEVRDNLMFSDKYVNFNIELPEIRTEKLIKPHKTVTIQ